MHYQGGKVGEGMKKKDREVTTEMEMRKEEREVMMKEREEQERRERRNCDGSFQMCC